MSVVALLGLEVYVGNDVLAWWWDSGAAPEPASFAINLEPLLNGLTLFTVSSNDQARNHKSRTSTKNARRISALQLSTRPETLCRNRHGERRRTFGPEPREARGSQLAAQTGWLRRLHVLPLARYARRLRPRRNIELTKSHAQAVARSSPCRPTTTAPA